MIPLIAITTTINPAGGAHVQPQVALYVAYMALFERLGLASVLVTPAHSAESTARLVALCSGLVLTGGEDVDPARYGEQPIPELGSVSPARDVMEFTALGTAVERRIPVLAICRGCQLLNVFFGGTLFQDISAQRPETREHEQSQPWGVHAHTARIEPDSLLARAVGATELHINSFHHQAIKDLAAPLRAVAWAEDGLIEGVEHPEHEWMLGVQWHPERHEATGTQHDADRKLLTEFGRAVAANGARRA